MRIAKEELEAASVARASLQLMLEDSLRRMQRSVAAAGLRQLILETKGGGPGRYALGF